MKELLRVPQWEMVPIAGSNGHKVLGKLFRLPVPGGWILQLYDAYEESVINIFSPDANHEWEIEKADKKTGEE